jgi:hypothetical protein
VLAERGVRLESVLVGNLKKGDWAVVGSSCLDDLRNGGSNYPHCLCRLYPYFFLYIFNSNTYTCVYAILAVGHVSNLGKIGGVKPCYGQSGFGFWPRDFVIIYGGYV